MSKQNLKLFNKVKRFDKEQRINFINALKTHTSRFSESIFKEILDKKKPDQLRVLRQIVLSLPINEIKEVFNEFETYYKEIISKKKEQIPTYLKVNDIEEVKSIISNTRDIVNAFNPEEILINGLRSFLTFNDLNLPNYIFEDLLNKLFSIQSTNGSMQNIDDEEVYRDELLGLNILEYYIIDIFNNIDNNLRIPLLISFLFWILFEKELIIQFEKTNHHLFFPEEEIGNFELAIYKSIVNILKQKFKTIFLDLDVITLIEIIENLYSLTKNTHIIIEPWKEYLMM